MIEVMLEEIRYFGLNLNCRPNDFKNDLAF